MTFNKYLKNVHTQNHGATYYGNKETKKQENQRPKRLGIGISSYSELGISRRRSDYRPPSISPADAWRGHETYS